MMLDLPNQYKNHIERVRLQPKRHNNTAASGNVETFWLASCLRGPEPAERLSYPKNREISDLSFVQIRRSKQTVREAEMFDRLTLSDGQLLFDRRILIRQENDWRQVQDRLAGQEGSSGGEYGARKGVLALGKGEPKPKAPVTACFSKIGCLEQFEWMHR